MTTAEKKELMIEGMSREMLQLSDVNFVAAVLVCNVIRLAFLDWDKNGEPVWRAFDRIMGEVLDRLSLERPLIVETLRRDLSK